MYEHNKEVGIAADATIKILELALDDVSDEQQIAEFLASAFGAFASVKGAIKEETKPLFKAKIFVFLGATIAARGLAFIQDDLSQKSRDLILASLAYVRRVVNILLPDSES